MEQLRIAPEQSPLQSPVALLWVKSGSTSLGIPRSFSQMACRPRTHLENAWRILPERR